jgi:hypothetical protein
VSRRVGCRTLNAAGEIHLAIRLPRPFPFAQEPARRTVNRHAIRRLLLAQPARGKMAHVNSARGIERDSAGIGPHRQHRQQPSVPVELLHPVVVVIGHEDLTLLIHGDADGKIKLARLLPLFAPLPHEPRRLHGPRAHRQHCDEEDEWERFHACRLVQQNGFENGFGNSVESSFENGPALERWEHPARWNQSPGGTEESSGARVVSQFEVSARPASTPHLGTDGSPSRPSPN